MTPGAVVLARGVVRLETADAVFVGWAQIPTYQKAPDVLTWGDRLFSYRGLTGTSAGEQPYLIYREAFFTSIGDVTKARPTP